MQCLWTKTILISRSLSVGPAEVNGKKHITVARLRAFTWHIVANSCLAVQCTSFAPFFSLRSSVSEVPHHPAADGRGQTANMNLAELHHRFCDSECLALSTLPIPRKQSQEPRTHFFQGICLQLWAWFIEQKGLLSSELLTTGLPFKPRTEKQESPWARLEGR